MALEFSKREGIALIGLNRPEAKNALDAAALKELEGAWREVAADPDIRVAILYSALPDIFCAGLDLKSVIPVLTAARSPQSESEQWLVDDPRAMFRAILRGRDWDKPVIAAVHGLCLTAGFEMTMGTDLRIASDDALFQMREATFGIMPIGGANVYLPRQIPLALAKEIVLLGATLSAARLAEWGFLNRAVPRGRLMDEAMAMAQQVCGNGPLAVQGCLRCMRETAEMEIAPAMAKELEIGLPIFSSADAREGVAAFREKRKADFQGK